MENAIIGFCRLVKIRDALVFQYNSFNKMPFTAKILNGLSEYLEIKQKYFDAYIESLSDEN